MDIGTVIKNAVSAGRRATFANSNQLSLGELISKLEAIPPTWKSYEEEDEPKRVYFDFGYLHPTHLMSWRGSYEELAIGFSEDDEAPTLEKFLGDLKSALGKEFTGYKGGEFKMDRLTPVWVANYGNSGETGVSGVEDRECNVILLTSSFEF